MLNAVIFDMDGLMFDTEKVFLWAYQTTGFEYGIVDIAPFYYRTLGTSQQESDLIIAEVAKSVSEAKEISRIARERVSAYYKTHTTPEMPGLRELLDYLKEKGYQLGVASGSSEKDVSFHLNKSGLWGCFGAVVHAGMVERCKPFPEPFLKCAELLGVDPDDCMVLEDSVNGVRAAYAAGMKPVMVPNLQQPDEATEELLFYKAKDLLAVRDWLMAR
ncbi:HAD family phosphatase [Christensenellaceae bacterium OttesenSCG-928-M15]|nr:HAD family phosphatase [Christensenellaceae bacterium OttesenSCG-928-M15]